MFWCLFVLTFAILGSKCTEFDDFKQEMESTIMQLASELEQHYSNWCDDGIATCESLSYFGRQGYMQKYCEPMFEKPEKCFTGGAFVSKASNVNFPPYENIRTLSQEDIRFVCSSAKLQKTLRKIASTRNKRFTYIYFGSNNGVFRLFPGEYFSPSVNYDPRIRPWYAISVSGSKNVIFMIDKTNKKAERNIKAAAISMIDTLSISDNLGVVEFGSSASMMGYFETLKSGNADNKQMLKEQIRSLSFEQSDGNIMEAFEKSFQIVNKTLWEGESGCSEAENIFVLVTHGGPNPSQSSDVLISRLNSLLQDKSSSLKRMTIIVYSLEKIKNSQFVRKITCNFNGFVIQTSSQQQEISERVIAKNLQKFYEYLSSGFQFTRPLWTEPYNDFFIGSELFAITMPVYYTDPSTQFKKIFGVVAMDILAKHLNDLESDMDKVVVKLFGESTCQKNNQNVCRLESLRSSSYQCEIIGCKFSNESVGCPIFPSSSEILLHDNIKITDKVCCGITKQQFKIILGFSVSGFVLLLILIIVALWKRKTILHFLRKISCCKKVLSQKKSNYEYVSSQRYVSEKKSNSDDGFLDTQITKPYNNTYTKEIQMMRTLDRL